MAYQSRATGRPSRMTLERHVHIIWNNSNKLKHFIRTLGAMNHSLIFGLVNARGDTRLIWMDTRPYDIDSVGGSPIKSVFPFIHNNNYKLHSIFGALSQIRCQRIRCLKEIGWTTCFCTIFLQVFTGFWLQDKFDDSGQMSRTVITRSVKLLWVDVFYFFVCTHYS